MMGAIESFAFLGVAKEEDYSYSSPKSATAWHGLTENQIL